jgi:hypothetical protein
MLNHTPALLCHCVSRDWIGKNQELAIRFGVIRRKAWSGSRNWIGA